MTARAGLDRVAAFVDLARRDAPLAVTGRDLYDRYDAIRATDPAVLDDDAAGWGALAETADRVLEHHRAGLGALVDAWSGSGTPHLVAGVGARAVSGAELAVALGTARGALGSVAEDLRSALAAQDDALARWADLSIPGYATGGYGPDDAALMVAGSRTGALSDADLARLVPGMDADASAEDVVRACRQWVDRTLVPTIASVVDAVRTVLDRTEERIGGSLASVGPAVDSAAPGGAVDGPAPGGAAGHRPGDPASAIGAFVDSVEGLATSVVNLATAVVDGATVVTDGLTDALDAATGGSGAAAESAPPPSVPSGPSDPPGPGGARPMPEPDAGGGGPARGGPENGSGPVNSRDPGGGDPGGSATGSREAGSPDAGGPDAPSAGESAPEGGVPIVGGTVPSGGGSRSERREHPSPVPGAAIDEATGVVLPEAGPL